MYLRFGIACVHSINNIARLLSILYTHAMYENLYDGLHTIICKKKTNKNTQTINMSQAFLKIAIVIASTVLFCATPREWCRVMAVIVVGHANSCVGRP